jgi:hypothetical protein
MRCQEFDAHIEELLSGMVPPEANEHMRQCERCTSYFRARTAVQNGLRNLARLIAAGSSPQPPQPQAWPFRRLTGRGF